MMTGINNNPFIDCYNLIEYVLKTYVNDINSTRRNLPTSVEKQWIFPYTPESLTLYYPRIAIVLNSVSYSELGSSRFLGYESTVEDGMNELKCNYVTLDLTIGVFTKKKDKHSVILPGDTLAKNISGSLLNFYLFGNVQKALLSYMDYFFQNGAEDVSITGLNSTYNDSEVLFASDVNISITLPNIWGTVYAKEDLLKIINTYYWVGLTGLTGPTGITGVTGI